MIKAYIVDGKEFCRCDLRGIPITEGRAKKRELSRSESELEKHHLKKMKKEGFIQQQSPSAAWIAVISGVNKASHMQVYSIAKFFSLLLDIEIPRESYRRRQCCLYWLDTNFEQIKNACREKSILILCGNDKTIMLTPPYDCNETSVPQKIDYKTNQISLPPDTIHFLDTKDSDLQLETKKENTETIEKLDRAPTSTFPRAIIV